MVHIGVFPPPSSLVSDFTLDKIHPWVTQGGEDMLLSAQENTADFIATPTEDEMASAITKSIRNVMAVVRH